MKYNWNNKEYELKNKITNLIVSFNDDKSNLSLLIKNLNAYDIINDSCDVFLFCALLNCEEVCTYWIKHGYKNRYFNDGKTTLYYLLTLVKNTKLINEVFIYWKLNDINFFKLYFENFEESNESNLMLLFYYMNNTICPCKMLIKENDIINYYFSIKNNRTCLCGECISKLVNNENHNCETIRNLFEEDKYIISFICQTIKCTSCLNYFLSKNSQQIKKLLCIHNKKLYFKVVYYYSNIKKDFGEFEDCIEYDDIKEDEKFYKCTSNVSHYYKENNWIKWCNYNSDMKDCCVCKLEMDKNLYINSKNDIDICTFNKREYLVNPKNCEENEIMYKLKNKN